MPVRLGRIALAVVIALSASSLAGCAVTPGEPDVSALPTEAAIPSPTTVAADSSPRAATASEQTACEEAAKLDSSEREHLRAAAADGSYQFSEGELLVINLQILTLIIDGPATGDLGEEIAALGLLNKRVQNAGIGSETGGEMLDRLSAISQLCSELGQPFGAASAQASDTTTATATPSKDRASPTPTRTASSATKPTGATGKRPPRAIEMGTITGNFVVDSSFDLTGILDGDLRVLDGGEASITGIVTGVITVEKGGFVAITGVVSEGITNNGGRVEIYGIVSGPLLRNGGVTVVHPGAVVDG